MRALRWWVIFALVIYAGWLAVPLLEHATGAAHLSQMPHVTAPAGLQPDSQSPLRAGLWIGAILFYLGAAVLLAGHNRRAFPAYLLGFASNMALFLLQPGAGGALTVGPALFLVVVLGLVGVLVQIQCRMRFAHA
jgi:hypothetical protein